MVLGLLLLPQRRLDCHNDGVLAGGTCSLQHFFTGGSGLGTVRGQMQTSSRSPASQVTGFSPLLSRDETVASQNFESLGMVHDGTSGRLRHSGRRIWRLWHALTKVLQMRRASGDALRVLGASLPTCGVCARGDLPVVASALWTCGRGVSVG